MGRAIIYQNIQRIVHFAIVIQVITLLIHHLNMSQGPVCSRLFSGTAQWTEMCNIESDSHLSCESIHLNHCKMKHVSILRLNLSLCVSSSRRWKSFPVFSLQGVVGNRLIVTLWCL